MKLLTKNETNWVTPSEMKDGDIGVIRHWSYHEALGIVVQKFGDNILVLLGAPSGKHMPNGGNITSRDYLIEILPPGTQLEI